jgi:hypothetical protein
MNVEVTQKGEGKMTDTIKVVIAAVGIVVSMLLAATLVAIMLSTLKPICTCSEKWPT